MLFVSIFLGQAITAQTPTPNPRNIEIAQKFNYILDNGFEKIDLMKVGTIDKSFFNLGNPQLIIWDKNDKTKKNLLNTFSLIVESSDPKIQSKVFQTPSCVFTSGCKQLITILPANSKITFTEVKLNTTLPVAVQQAPGSKHTLAPGMLPIAFFLYIK
ncbi:MAG: hypothetical protein CFE21_04720 [Bacteroidetes bacterium B1(2017)]|nr:MAG: hypothetical protein CFE21_04720 [Bacteroidetes bacterium B1(2017)]